MSLFHQWYPIAGYHHVLLGSPWPLGQTLPGFTRCSSSLLAHLMVCSEWMDGLGAFLGSGFSFCFAGVRQGLAVMNQHLGEEASEVLKSPTSDNYFSDGWVIW